MVIAHSLTCIYMFLMVYIFECIKICCTNTLLNNRANCSGVESRLQEMISLWMKNGTSASWEHLAAALGKIQTYKLATANRLRQAVGLPAGNVHVCSACVVTVLVFGVKLYHTCKCKHIFQKVGMAVPKTMGTRYGDGSVQATHGIQWVRK